MFSVKSRILFIILGNLLMQGIGAQSIDKVHITENIANKSLIEIIDLLEHKYKIPFTYESELVKRSTLFTTSINNVSLNEFLLAILKEVDLNYRIINNHVVLYYYKWPKKEEPAKESKRAAIPQESIKSQGQKIVPQEDHIIIYDTIVYTVNDTVIHTVYDTFRIQLVDTLIVYDTVRIVIEPEIEDTDIVEPSKVHQEPRFTVGTRGGLQYPFTNAGPYIFTIPDSETDMNSSTVNYVPSWQAGLLFEEYYKQAFLQTGLNMLVLSREIQLHAIYTTEVPNTDITDSYYAISNGDTAWYDVIEDEFVTQTDTLTGSPVNRAYYLQIPVSIGYDFKISPSFSTGILGGVKGNILVAESTKPATSVVVSDENKVPGISLSLTGGIRINYKIRNDYRISVQAEYMYTIKQAGNHLTLSLLFSKSFY